MCVCVIYIYTAVWSEVLKNYIEKKVNDCLAQSHVADGHKYRDTQATFYRERDIGISRLKWDVIIQSLPWWLKAPWGRKGRRSKRGLDGENKGL